MNRVALFPLVAGLLLGASQLVFAANATFTVNDTPGHWFDTGVDIDGTGPSQSRSVAVVNPGNTVFFKQTQVAPVMSRAAIPSQVSSGPKTHPNLN